MSIAAVMVLLAVIVVPAVQQARESARRDQSKNNLKQIGLALYNYQDVYKCFPPGGVFNSQGRGQSGWMLAIMPYVDASPIYSGVDFDEPWDSVRNAGGLMARIPCYQIPGQPAPRSENEFFVAHYSANSHLLGPNSGVRIDAEELSKSENFLAAELAGDFVPWPCGHNWRPLTSLNGQPATYGRYSREGAYFLFVDGHVDFISNAAMPSLAGSLSGPDLAAEFSRGLKLPPRPDAFPAPAETLVPVTFDLPRAIGSSNRFLSGTRRLDGRLVALSNQGSFKYDLVSVSDADLRVIARQTHLEVLAVEGEFTDQGLRQLESLKELRSLSLWSDAITEEGLGFATRLPHLRLLGIFGAQITETKIDRLRAALPNCDVRRLNR